MTEQTPPIKADPDGWVDVLRGEWAEQARPVGQRGELFMTKYRAILAANKQAHEGLMSSRQRPAEILIQSQGWPHPLRMIAKPSIDSTARLHLINPIPPDYHIVQTRHELLSSLPAPFHTPPNSKPRTFTRKWHAIGDPNTFLVIDRDHLTLVLLNHRDKDGKLCPFTRISHPLQLVVGFSVEAVEGGCKLSYRVITKDAEPVWRDFVMVGEVDDVVKSCEAYVIPSRGGGFDKKEERVEAIPVVRLARKLEEKYGRDEDGMDMKEDTRMNELKARLREAVRQAKIMCAVE